MNRRTKFRVLVISFAAALAGSSASADTIENFIVISSGASLSPAGGMFSDGGRYWGSFSLDVTAFPSIPMSWDIFTTGTYKEEFSSNLGGQFTFSAPPLSSFPTGNEEAVSLTVGNPNAQLTLDLIEPPQTFHGGLVLLADESAGPGTPLVSDTSGSAYIIDPVVLPRSAPEPRSGLLSLAGVGFLLALIGCCRLRN